MAGKGKRGRKAKDLTGQQFGSLSISGRAEGKLHGQTLWRCQCVCGIEVINRYANLTSGTSTHCGCLGGQKPKDRKTQEGRKRPRGEGGFAALYAGYRVRAKNKQIDFELTRDQFRTLTKEACFYCDAEPAGVFTANEGLNSEAYTAYVYNGIDRRVNGEGYTQANSVACCAKCNYAKRDHTEEVYINWVVNVFLNVVNQDRFQKYLQTG